MCVCVLWFDQITNKLNWKCLSCIELPHNDCNTMYIPTIKCLGILKISISLTEAIYKHVKQFKHVYMAFPFQ